MYAFNVETFLCIIIFMIKTFCVECRKEIFVANILSNLCDNCLRKLSKECKFCKKIIYNTELLSKSRFLKGKITCSKECENLIKKERLTIRNPMFDAKIAMKVGETQKTIHHDNVQFWKQKYRDAKFKHWIDLSNGVITGSQKNNTNSSSISFFQELRKIFNWENDEDYFECNPYEFPLIVSIEKQICFFPDYYNKTKNIIIEWDERYHKSKKMITKDKRRDSLIKNKFPIMKIVRLPEENFHSNDERFKYISEQIS